MPSDGGLDGVAIERFHHAEHQVAFGCFHLKAFRSGDELVFVQVKELCLEHSLIHFNITMISDIKTCISFRILHEMQFSILDRASAPCDPK